MNVFRSRTPKPKGAPERILQAISGGRANRAPQTGIPSCGAQLQDLALPGNQVEAFERDRKGQQSLRINGRTIARACQTRETLPDRGSLSLCAEMRKR